MAVPGVTPSLGAQLGLRDVGQSSEPGEQSEPQDFTAELWMEHYTGNQRWDLLGHWEATVASLHFPPPILKTT